MRHHLIKTKNIVPLPHVREIAQSECVLTKVIKVRVQVIAREKHPLASFGQGIQLGNLPCAQIVGLGD